MLAGPRPQGPSPGHVGLPRKGRVYAPARLGPRMSIGVRVPRTMEGPLVRPRRRAVRVLSKTRSVNSDPPGSGLLTRRGRACCWQLLRRRYGPRPPFRCARRALARSKNWRSPGSGVVAESATHPERPWRSHAVQGQNPYAREWHELWTGSLHAPTSTCRMRRVRVPRHEPKCQTAVAV